MPRLLGQALAYAMAAAGTGYFSSAPSYEILPPDRALVQLSFSHAGSPQGECRRLTPEELAALAPNMRRPLECPRRRVALVVELWLDAKLLYRASLEPSGLAGDGASTVYRRFVVTPGNHHLVAKLRDTNRAEGFDYEREADVSIAPLQNFVIDFRADGGFRFL